MTAKSVLQQECPVRVSGSNKCSWTAEYCVLLLY